MLSPSADSTEKRLAGNSTVSPLLLNFQRKLNAGGSASTLQEISRASPLDAPTTIIRSSLQTGASAKSKFDVDHFDTGKVMEIKTKIKIVLKYYNIVIFLFDGK